MNGPPRGRWSTALLQWGGALVLVPTGCSEESSTSRTVVSVASAQVSSARLSAARWPQGAIHQIAGGLALDASGHLWAVGGQDRFQPYRYPTWGRVVGIFEWPALRMADGRVHTIEHDAPGMNPNVRASWRQAAWDRDGDAVAFAVARHPPLISERNIEYVEARGADELYWGCFRRGTKVYRSGVDWGCPSPDERVVRTTVAPELPDEVPGAPDALGTCWRPVEQTIEATRLFPGCLVLDRRGTLHDLHITGAPVALAHDVWLATTVVRRGAPPDPVGVLSTDRACGRAGDHLRPHRGPGGLLPAYPGPGATWPWSRCTGPRACHLRVRAGGAGREAMRRGWGYGT